MLPGLERPAGPGQLPGAGLQQVRRSSGNILMPAEVQPDPPPPFHRGSYFGWGQQQAAPGGRFLRLKPDLHPEASVLQQFELTCV